MRWHVYLSPRLLLVVVGFISAGCVAPGSSIGRISVAGEIVSKNGEPVPNEKIEIVLPAAYGLGGLDKYFGEPEDYGNRTQTYDLTTGPNGKFAQPLGEHVYHISFWLLPPLGGFPRRPPPPFLLIRLPDRGDEVYAIETWSGEFKVLDISGEELEASSSMLFDFESRVTDEDSEEFRGTRAILSMTIRDKE